MGEAPTDFWWGVLRERQSFEELGVCIYEDNIKIELQKCDGDS
jgi:hypothetical protein